MKNKTSYHFTVPLEKKRRNAPVEVNTRKPVKVTFAVGRNDFALEAEGWLVYSDSTREIICCAGDLKPNTNGCLTLYRTCRRLAEIFGVVITVRVGSAPAQPIDPRSDNVIPEWNDMVQYLDKKGAA